MTPDEAKQWIIDALADLPSGPDGEEVLNGLLAAAWEEGYMFSYDQERGGHGVGAIPIPEYLANDLAHWNPHRTSDA